MDVVGCFFYQGVDMDTVRAKAWSIGSRLTIRELAGWPPPISTIPLTFPGHQGGFAVLFRFGAVCSVALERAEEDLLLAQAAEFATEPRKIPVCEEVEIVIAEDREEGIDPAGRLNIRELSPGRAQVIACVLAKSAVLSDYEGEVTAVFERIEPFAQELKAGRSRKGGKMLLRELGDVLLIQSRMVGRAEIREKPDIAWDDPELDRLYEKLAQEFELGDREDAMIRKLELISRSANAYYDHMMGKRALRVEWYIVLLILVEIIILLYEMLLQR